ncbi:MAG: VWA domain-containing protein [Bdellovibrionales bacterium]|nr:VWA domain-containing protein [Bdellovibrionales bacterium]
MKIYKLLLICFSFLIIACAEVDFDSGGGPQLTCVNCNDGSELGFIDGLSLIRHTVKLTQTQTKVKSDILFVIDNSGSMSTEHKNLTARFSTFISSIKDLNWRVCITTTDFLNDDGKLYHFSDGNTWLDAGDNQANEKFLEVIQTISNQDKNGRGDERGIYSINRVLERKQSCLRDDATLTTIVLSDENEGSDGTGSKGNPMVEKDEPESIINNIKSNYPQKLAKYSHHSLVIKSGDENCKKEQASQTFNNNKVPAYYGTFYEELSQLSGGTVGTVCSNDYGAQLKIIGAVIRANTIGKVQLLCSPLTKNKEPITNASHLIYNAEIRPIIKSLMVSNEASFQISDPNTDYAELDIVYYCLDEPSTE